MARKFLTPIDLAQNELQNAKVQNLGTAPSAPVRGQLYYNSTPGNDTLYWWDGTQWVPAKASASVPLSNSASSLVPGNASSGGAATDASRGDHVHGLPAFAAPSAQTSFGQASSAGSAGTFVRSDHLHGTPAHDNAAHSTIPLSALAAATADIAMGNNRITGLGGAIAATDAPNYGQVQSLVNGLTWKNAVNVATTANITLSGTQTIDGVSVLQGYRVLVKNQTNPAENGIWNASTGAWSRSADADSTGELANATVYAAAGTTQADTAWTQTADVITVGVTGQTWVQAAGPGTVTGGAGLTQTGNTLDVVAGDTSLTVAANDVRVNTAVIATVASLAGYQPLDSDLTALAGVSSAVQGFYVKNGDGVATARQITGSAPITVTNTNGVSGNPNVSIANFTTTVAGAVPPPTTATGKFLRDDGTWQAGGVAKFAAACAAATSTVVNHALNTRDVIVDVYRTTTPWETVEADVERTDVNNVTVRFATAPTAGEYRIVVTA